jgi:hypothetical protein
MNGIPLLSEQALLGRDELEKYLFSRQLFPHWGYDAKRLLTGLEVEYFIVSQDDPQKLFDRDSFEKMLVLMREFGFDNDHAKPGVIRVSRDVPKGFIVIEPDYGYHVLELAFPPCAAPSELAELLDMTLGQLDRCLAVVGFKRSERSVFDDLPSNWEPVNTSRLEGFAARLKNSVEIGKRTIFTEPTFGARLAATHVHLNISSAEDVALLPLYYETEWIAHRLFSKGESWHGRPCQSARAMVYWATFPKSYKLCHIPDCIAASDEELYHQYLTSTPALFVGDPPHGVKDMSSIRPRPFGSVEFRSADSFTSTKDLIEVCAFRILQAIYGKKFRNKYISSVQNWQSTSVRHIAQMSVPSELIMDRMKLSLNRLASCRTEVAPCWSPIVDQFLERLEIQMKRDIAL